MGLCVCVCLFLADDDKHDLSRGFDGRGVRRGVLAPLSPPLPGTTNMPIFCQEACLSHVAFLFVFRLYPISSPLSSFRASKSEHVIECIRACRFVLVLTTDSRCRWYDIYSNVFLFCVHGVDGVRLGLTSETFVKYKHVTDLALADLTDSGGHR